MSTASSADDDNVVRFVPFSSGVEASFWIKVSDHKLHAMRLEEGPVRVLGSYGRTPPATTSRASPRVRLGEEALRVDDADAIADGTMPCPGALYVHNTLEAFKRVDRNEALRRCADDMVRTDDPEAWCSTLVLSFLDLKKHAVVYWCAFPALATAPGRTPVVYDDGGAPRPLSSSSSSGPSEADLASAFRDLRARERARGRRPSPWFRLSRPAGDGAPWTCASLTDPEDDEDPSRAYGFGLLDPSHDPRHPGWPLRSLVAYLALRRGRGGRVETIACYRPRALRRLGNNDDDGRSRRRDDADASSSSSLLLRVRIPPASDYLWPSSSDDDDDDDRRGGRYQCVGWERNAKGKLAPRALSLATLLSPSYLSETATHLNLSLMKWRAVPDLDVDRLTSSRCLLIGAGTLGCAVARTLVGWGVSRVIFVDSGVVTRGNPARQSLYEAADVGKDKAATAAAALRRVVPGCRTEGVRLEVPMPGHDRPRRGDGDDAPDDAVELDRLVRDECDVVFLLTDTRESRWLPTLLARRYGRLLVNAALGLDTWLVMRHGESDDGRSRLGCYFCNDVVAPENSTRERALDQQCTVTRPGAAYVAGATAAELFAARLHRDTGALGSPVPHQIRGSLSTHQVLTPTTPAFEHCTACGDRVVEECGRLGVVGMVDRVCRAGNDGVEWLERLSGLRAFRERAETVDVDWEEDEDEE